MNSCFIQYNAPLVGSVKVAQEVNALSKNLFVFSQLLIHFNILEIRVVSVAVQVNVHLVCVSLKIDAHFSPTIKKLSILDKKFHLLNKRFQNLAIVEFLPELA